MNLSSNSKRTPPPPRRGTRNYRFSIIGPLLAAFASALLLAACPNPGDTIPGGGTSTGGTTPGGGGVTGPAAPATTVTGTVQDASRPGVGLPGAKVTASTNPETTTITDSGGAFRFEVTHSGSLSFTLSAEKACYNTAPAQSITLTDNTAYKAKAIELPPGPEPTGNDRFSLTPPEGPAYTLTIADCVRTVTAGEFASASQTIPGESTPRISRLADLPEFAAAPHDKVTALELPDSLITIESRAFYDHRKVTGRLVIPASVESIGSLAFREMGRTVERTSLLRLEFAPNSRLRSIGRNAFQNGGIHLASPLPRSLKTIENYAFHLALHDPVSNFIIPENVTKVGELAFASGSSLRGTLTIESPHLKRTPPLPPNPTDPLREGRSRGRLGDSAFSELMAFSAPVNIFSAVFLPSAVFDSYTQADLNAIFGTGGSYFDISDTEKTNPLTK